VKAWVSYSSSADSRVFSARYVTLRLLFAFIHFNHKFHEQSQGRPHHWAAQDSVSPPWGTLVWLAPQTKLPAPQIQIWKTINKWGFCLFSECQDSLHKRKSPLLKTFWTAHRNIYESIQNCIKELVSLLDFNMKQSWKSLLWPGCGKWNGQHIAAILVVSSTILAQHGLCLTSETMWLLKCSEISKINWVVCYRTVMVEVAKPIIMANSVHQGLQGSYFSIHCLFFQNSVNQMHALSYHVNFIWNAVLMKSMK